MGSVARTGAWDRPSACHAPRTAATVAAARLTGHRILAPTAVSRTTKRVFRAEWTKRSALISATFTMTFVKNAARRATRASPSASAPQPNHRARPTVRCLTLGQQIRRRWHPRIPTLRAWTRHQAPESWDRFVCASASKHGSCHMSNRTNAQSRCHTHVRFVLGFNHSTDRNCVYC